MNRTGIQVLFFSLAVLQGVLATACSSPHPAKKKKVAHVQVVDTYNPSFNKLSDFARLQYRDSVKEFLYNTLKLDDYHGMVLVAKNGEIILERYLGLANEAEGIPFGPETPIHVASISKTVTAVAVLRLVDKGLIGLDTEVRRYLPEFPYEGLTVRMLLTHRSGLPYYGYFPKAIAGIHRDMTNKRIFRILKFYNMPLNFPPDTHFAYCNTNYALLALVVEKVTGKAFPEAMQQLIFDPLNMEHSYIGGQESPPGNQALSYNSKGILQADTELDPVYGDKNLYTTARDLLRFDKATYSDNFLSQQMKREMFRGYSYEHPGTANYGLGIRIRELPGKPDYFFHTGWWHGNTGCYVNMRSDTVCMIMLSNHYSRKVFGVHGLARLFEE